MSSQGRNVFGAGDNLKARPRGDDVLCIPGLLGTLESSFHWMTNSRTPSFERCVAEMLMLAKRISVVEREETTDKWGKKWERVLERTFHD